MCAGHGLGLMSIGVIVGRKLKFQNTALSACALLLLWIYIDCSTGPLCGGAVEQLACNRGPKG